VKGFKNQCENSEFPPMSQEILEEVEKHSNCILYL